MAWFVANFDDRLVYLHRGFVVHAMVAYIGWRAVAAIERVALIVGYAAVVVTGLWSIPLSAVLLSCGLVGLAAHRVLRARGRLRGERKTALVAAVVFSSAVVANAILRAVAHDHSASTPMLVLYEVALCAVAMLLAAGVVAPRAERCDESDGRVGRVAIRRAPRCALAHVLRDPSLRVAYHSMDAGGYHNRSGRVVSVPPTVGGRAATLVERESRPFVVLVHDASVLDEPALVECRRRPATAIVNCGTPR